MAALCVFSGFRARALSLLVLAPIPALITALWAPEGTFVFFPAPFRMTLALDRPGALLLGGAALLWSAAGAFAAAYMAGKPRTADFAIWWLLTLTGSLGTFVVADIASFYLVFGLVSLAAFGLISHEQTGRAQHAGTVYLVLALIGEACLLLAFVMLAAGSPDANPLIRDVVARLPSSPMRDGIIALLVLGFALKMGLVPLHVWLPLAHPAAPMPASAVLSGVVVKAGVIGLIRFLPFEAGLPGWGAVLVLAGIVTAYYGVIVGVTQPRAKTILAYSTVSQMGLLAVLLGLSLGEGDPGGVNLVAYYCVHHTLVKGGLFLAVGIVAATGGTRLRPVLLLTTILALSLGGLPLTSGALAKLAAKPMLGYGAVGMAMSVAAAGSTLLMVHFIATVAGDARGSSDSAPPASEAAPWLVVALAALVVPWSLYPAVSGDPVLSALQPDAIWKLVWPMALGGVALPFLRRFRAVSGSIPEGDILVLAERCGPIVRRLGDRVEWLDAGLRRWPVAGLLLLCIAIALAGSLIAWP